MLSSSPVPVITDVMAWRPAHRACRPGYICAQRDAAEIQIMIIYYLENNVSMHCAYEMWSVSWDATSVFQTDCNPWAHWSLLTVYPNPHSQGFNKDTFSDQCRYTSYIYMKLLYTESDHVLSSPVLSALTDYSFPRSEAEAFFSPVFGNSGDRTWYRNHPSSDPGDPWWMWTLTQSFM